MYQSRALSVVLSFCLHAVVLAAALFWPAGSQPPVDLTAPVIDVNLYTIGRPGRAAPDAPRAPAAPARPQAAPEAPATAPPTPPPPPKEVAPPAPPTPVKPEAKPVPIPQPEKPAVEPKPVEQPKPEPVKPAQPTKPQQRPEEALSSALRELRAQNKQPARGAQSGGESLDAALRDLRKNSGSATGTDAEGDGPGGAGGDGIGIVGSYMQSLVSRIKQNYEYVGRADRKNPMAIVEIHIAKDGAIIDARIVESSGDEVFNGFVLSAVRNTHKVEPPPTPDLARVRLSFAYQEMR